MATAPVETEGRRLLRQFFERTKKSHTWLSKILYVSQPAVSSWVAGTARPERHMALVLERICGIPASAWLTDAERDYIVDTFARVASGPEEMA